MGRQFKAMFEVRKEGLIINFIILVCAMVLGVVIAFFTMDDFDVEVMRIAAGAAGAGTYVSMSIFFRIVYYSMESQRSVLFGMTRKQSFLMEKLFDLMEIAVIAFIVALVIPGNNYMMIIKTALLVFGLFSFLEGVGGTSVIRYGKTAYWVCYITIFVIFIGLPKILHFIPGAFDKFTEIVQGFSGTSYNQSAIWTFIICLIVISELINWITFRKIAVSSSMG